MDAKSIVDDVIGLIRELAKEGVLPRDLARTPISGASTIEDLNLDSLGTLSLFAALDERRGMSLPDDMIEPNLTLEALATKISWFRSQGGGVAGE